MHLLARPPFPLPGAARGESKPAEDPSSLTALSLPATAARPLPPLGFPLHRFRASKPSLEELINGSSLLSHSRPQCRRAIAAFPSVCHSQTVTHFKGRVLWLFSPGPCLDLFLVPKGSPPPSTFSVTILQLRFIRRRGKAEIPPIPFCSSRGVGPEPSGSDSVSFERVAAAAAASVHPSFPSNFEEENSSQLLLHCLQHESKGEVLGIINLLVAANLSSSAC